MRALWGCSAGPLRSGCSSLCYGRCLVPPAARPLSRARGARGPAAARRAASAAWSRRPPGRWA
eukprot:4339034-Alexandrium_andersonii.AAC.1